MPKQSPGMPKQSPGTSEQSPGTSKQSLGTPKRSPGMPKQSPEKLKTLITSLFLSFERRGKNYIATTYSASESAKNVLKWIHTLR